MSTDVSQIESRSPSDRADRISTDEQTVEADAIVPIPRGFDEPDDESTTTRLAMNDSTSANQPRRTKDAQVNTELIRLSAEGKTRSTYEILQQWEGIVRDVADDTFWADLYDLGEDTTPEEIVEIPVVEVSPADRALVAEGAAFYWSVGYETDSAGTTRRVSELTMRRTPRWTQRDLGVIKKEAQDMMQRVTNGAREGT